MATTIKRKPRFKNELDIKEDPSTGKQRVFSIVFDKKTGNACIILVPFLAV